MFNSVLSYFTHAQDSDCADVFAEDADVAPSLSGEAYDAEEVVAQWALPWSPSQSLVDANASINASAVVGSLECDCLQMNKTLLRTDNPVIASLRLRLPASVARERVVRATLIEGIPDLVPGALTHGSDVLYYALRVVDLTQQRVPLPTPKIVVVREALLLVPSDAVSAAEVKLELQLRFLLRPTKMFRDDGACKKKPEAALVLECALVLCDASTPLTIASPPTRLVFNNNESRKRRPSDKLAAPSDAEDADAGERGPSPKRRHVLKDERLTPPPPQRALSATLSSSGERISDSSARADLPPFPLPLLTSSSSSSSSGGGGGSEEPQTSAVNDDGVRVLHRFECADCEPGDGAELIVVTEATGLMRRLPAFANPHGAGVSSELRIAPGRYHYAFLRRGNWLLNWSQPYFTDHESGVTYNIALVETDEQRSRRVWHSSLADVSLADLLHVAAKFDAAHLLLPVPTPASSTSLSSSLSSSSPSLSPSPPFHPPLVSVELVAVGLPRSGKSSLLNAFWFVANAFSNARHEADAPFAAYLHVPGAGARSVSLHYGRCLPSSTSAALSAFGESGTLVTLTDTWGLFTVTSSAAQMQAQIHKHVSGRGSHVAQLVLHVHRAHASSDETRALAALLAQSDPSSALVVLLDVDDGAKSTLVRNLSRALGIAPAQILTVPSLSEEVTELEVSESAQRRVVLALLTALREAVARSVRLG